MSEEGDFIGLSTHIENVVEGDSGVARKRLCRLYDPYEMTQQGALVVR